MFVTMRRRNAGALIIFLTAYLGLFAFILTPESLWTVTSSAVGQSQSPGH
ncbi:hypothetical protein JMK10_15775 [Rhodovulum sulfidophilum]|nr:hypothetical protein [Rhodovulum sulfidophilum]MBL3575911.1 hypothetical protein [Rhodovulum sulfidophilum]MCE8432823.1 hypothetical protein [Rhodovulum sulfidophilum]MCF4118227.1 hypothetical protein [Rhodovulum sulfidophilum]